MVINNPISICFLEQSFWWATRPPVVIMISDLKTELIEMLLRFPLSPLLCFQFENQLFVKVFISRQNSHPRRPDSHSLSQLNQTLGVINLQPGSEQRSLSCCNPESFSKFWFASSFVSKRDLFLTTGSFYPLYVA